MLSAVVVSVVNEQPGAGFYWLAKQKSLMPQDASTQEQRAFWERERERAYEVWAV